MLRLEDDERPFEEIWHDYLQTMAETAWQEINQVELRPDIKTFSKLTASGHAGVWPLLDDDKVVGYVVWMINEDLFTSTFVFAVVSLYIMQECRSAVNLKTLMRLLKAKIKSETGIKRYTVMSNKYKSRGDRIWIGEV